MSVDIIAPAMSTDMSQVDLTVLVTQKYELFLFRTYEEQWQQYGSFYLFTSK
jgi:hypothetical protein